MSAQEPAGAEEKEWLSQPTSDGPADQGDRWLFKPVEEHEDWSQGEDWTEKVSAGIAELMRVPHAQVELAHRHGRIGNLSRNLRPHGWQMQPGVAVLAERDSAYRPGWDKVPGRPGHSLAAIQHALADFTAPASTELPAEFESYDVFCGYLVLDALIANQDRHDENWSVLIPDLAGDRPTLCPSYDHAGSLGFNLQDQKRQSMIDQSQVEAWATKGRAHRFEHTPRQPISLVDHALLALHRTSQDVQRFWLDQVSTIDVTYVTDCLARVPGLSVPAATFAREVVRINRRRLLDDC